MSKCPELSYRTNLFTTTSLSLNNVDPNARFVNPDGTYQLDQINVLENAFLNNVTGNFDSNILTDAIDTYGEDEFYSSLNDLNNSIITNPGSVVNDILGQTQINSDLPQYEVIYNMVQEGTVIQPFDFAMFMDEFNYTPVSITDLVNTSGTGNVTSTYGGLTALISNLNSFFNGSWFQSVAGSFCNTLPSVFAAIKLFDEIAKGAQSALASLSKIINLENPLQALFDKIKVEALINSIKEKILGVVDRTVEKIKNVIQNFSLSNIMGQVETFINEKIALTMAGIKEKAEALLSGDFVKEIKDKAEGMIDYAINLLENPTLAQIQFLMARFCGLTAAIGEMLEDTKKPLSDFVRKYRRNYGVIKSRSDLTVARRVEAGAARYDDQVRKQKVEEINSDIRQTESTDPLTDAPDTDGDPPDFTGNPTDPWGTAKYGARPKLRRVISLEEIEQLPRWEDMDIKGDSFSGSPDPRLYVLPGNQSYNYFKKQNGTAAAMWTEIGQKEKVMLMRVQKRFGKRLRLISGYRPTQLNSSVGGVTNGQHEFKRAMDITWDGFSLGEAKSFGSIAAEEQFMGIGYYPDKSFVHIDSRTETPTKNGPYNGLVTWTKPRE